jgi:hypothetical protein
MSMGDMSQHAEREERKILNNIDVLELKIDIIKRIIDLSDAKEFLIDVLIDLKKINNEIPN